MGTMCGIVNVDGDIPKARHDCTDHPALHERQLTAINCWATCAIHGLDTCFLRSRCCVMLLADECHCLFATDCVEWRAPTEQPGFHC